MTDEGSNAVVLVMCFVVAIIMAVFSHGCACAQKHVDDVCDIVAKADHYNAQVYRAVMTDADAPASTRSAAENLSDAVEQAHAMCFEEP